LQERFAVQKCEKIQKGARQIGQGVVGSGVWLHAIDLQLTKRIPHIFVIIQKSIKIKEHMDNETHRQKSRQGHIPIHQN